MLAENDPVQFSLNQTTLQVAATYRNLDTKHIDLLENVMLGKQRVGNWEYHVEQKLCDMLDEHTNIW